MSDYRDLMAEFDDQAPIWYGTVAKNAVATTTEIPVIIPAYDKKLQWGPCRWSSRDGIAMPKRGDACLIAFDDRRDPWIIAWWPTVNFYDPRIFTSDLNDDPPDEANDTDIWIAYDVLLGIRWQFQLNASSPSPYKWECIGGSPLYAQGTSPTLSLQLPRAGDYGVQWAAYCHSTASAWADTVTTTSGSIVGNTGQTGIDFQGGGGGGQIQGVDSMLSGIARVTGAAKNAVIAHGITGQSTVYSAELSVIPRRIS